MEDKNYRLSYVLILSVNRNKTLFDNQEYKDSFKKITDKVINYSGFNMVTFEETSIYSNYVRVTLSLVPQVIPINFLKTFKSMLAKEWFKKYPETRELLRGSLWENRKYLFVTIDPDNNSEQLITEFIKSLNSKESRGHHER